MSSRILTAAALGLALCGGALADTYDIRTFGAVSGDGIDDAAAVRAAVAAAAAGPDRGGTIYIPTGEWTFSSLDPRDLAGLTHVLVMEPSIKFVGDGASAHGSMGTPGQLAMGGSRISTTSVIASAFKVAVWGNGTNYAQQSGGVEFENITIRNSAPAVQLLPSSAGVMIASLGLTPSSWVFGPVTLRNVRVLGFYNGLSSQYGQVDSPGVGGAAQVKSLTLQDCHFVGNANHGAYVRDFTDFKIIGSEFADNGRDGLNVQAYYFSSGLYAVASRFTNNVGAGASVRGERLIFPTNWLLDVHFSACQFTSNGAQGISIGQARNVQIAGSTVSYNNTQGATNGTSSAVYLGDVHGVGVFGTTFSDNYRRAFTMTAANGVSISACSFVRNCASLTTAHALLVNGGSSHTYAALSFVGSATNQQKYGIELQNNPVNILGTGLMFEDGMTSIFSAWYNVASARYLFQYYAGGVMSTAQQ